MSYENPNNIDNYEKVEFLLLWKLHWNIAKGAHIM